MDDTSVLEGLVIDDDVETLKQLTDLLPSEIGTFKIHWDFSQDFEEALQILARRRYDILISDIYRDRKSPHKTISEGDMGGRDIVEEMRAKRFCPIVLYTDGQVPPNLVSKPFVQSADKGHANIDQLKQRVSELLDTGVPTIARRLHDELDRYAGSYLWEFLAEKWQALREKQGIDPSSLERLIRRRAAIQLGRIETGTNPPVERETADPADYYVYPPIGSTLRLGEILKRRGSDDFRVLLTPHCHLVIQPSSKVPRADYVLTARTLAANAVLNSKKWSTAEKQLLDELRKRTGVPSQFGTPDGRYCFLPAFMDVPDLYCDLLQLESLPLPSVVRDFERIAVLDAPFAEALQASFGRLYSAVGIPNLELTRIAYLRPVAEKK
jgi:CheY-like chemotaxis protein